MVTKKKYGTSTEYRMLHYWVEKQLGKPKRCEECLMDDPSRRYDWANISGEYRRDVADWKRLCRSCHAKMDGIGTGRPRGTHCRRGHELTEDNVYQHPTGGRMCRECKSEYRRNYRAVWGV